MLQEYFILFTEQHSLITLVKVKQFMDVWNGWALQEI